jgi:hypothetical protein
VQAYEFWVSHTMERVVLGNYGKLMEVGKAVLGEQAWQLDQNTSVTLTALRGNAGLSVLGADPRGVAGLQPQARRPLRAAGLLK